MPEVLEMTDAEYFASYADYMTATQLKTFKRSPLIFDLERRGVIDKPETQTLRDGSAFHCAILEGRETFLERYTVTDGPINGRTGKPYGPTTKAFQSWLDEQSNPATRAAGSFIPRTLALVHHPMHMARISGTCIHAKGQAS